ncbi:MAG TPA: hypothetical protein VM141_04840 [Planctomycetota bacterium]|nr:hypothetical protein [Planctomycetota bacterium]
MGKLTRQTCLPSLEFSNGFVLTLAGTKEHFAGIADVHFNETPLRSPALPWMVYTESDDGFRFDTFRLREVKATASEALIVFSSVGTWMPRLQCADALGDARVATRSLAPPTATFRWRFRETIETIHENTWTGLAMQVEVHCPGHPVHWLIEDTTWELGGSAAGCTLIQQDLSSIDLEQSVRADSAFSTIEQFQKRGDDGKTWGGSYPMDMLPRCAGASPLDFQVKDNLAMCLFAEKPSLTRARLAKFADEDVIHHTDRPFFPLSEHAAAPERKLLVYRHPRPLKRHEWRNLWLDAFTEVRGRIHSNYGFAAERPRPQLWVMLWNAELGVYGPEWVDALIAALPTYRRLGYTDVETHGVFIGTSNDPKREDKNVCCNYEYIFADEFGGNAAMKRLYDAAHAQGIRMWQWFGLEFDMKSRLWAEHPEWILREANGDPWDGGYPHLCCGRMRSKYADYLLESISRIRAETGLDAIFWDSYQNMGATCVDWQAPDKAPQAEEIWRFQAALQKLGFTGQRCETVTIFGITNVGMYGFDNEPDGLWRLRRRSWSTTLRNDDMFAWLDASPGFFSDNPCADGRLTPDKYFWMVGHRAVPCLDARPWGAEHRGVKLPPPSLPGGNNAEEYARVNHLYLAALPHMERLRLTEGGKYTLWLDEHNQPSVIWAFEDAKHAYVGRATDLESGETTQAKGTLTLLAGRVYLLGA